MICHQRVIRERLLDRPVLDNSVLDNARVVPISNGEAASIILKCEWLGTMAAGTRFCYALKVGNEVLGVECFSSGGSAQARSIVDIPATKVRANLPIKTICLARGTCVPHAPVNAGSFLVRWACKQAYEDFGYNVFFAYSDPAAGEVGMIYQAVGWKYISPANATSGQRSFTSSDGKVSVSSYEFGRRKRTEYKFYRLGWDGIENKREFLRRLGFIEKIEPTKGKYVWFEGDVRQRRFLRKHCRFPFLPYPKREHDACADGRRELVYENDARDVPMKETR